MVAEGKNNHSALGDEQARPSKSQVFLLSMPHLRLSNLNKPPLVGGQAGQDRIGCQLPAREGHRPLAVALLLISYVPRSQRVTVPRPPEIGPL